MSALCARATAASAGSAVSAPQPAAARCGVHQREHLALGAGSAGAAAAAGAGAGAGAGPAPAGRRRRAPGRSAGARASAGAGAATGSRRAGRGRGGRLVGRRRGRGRRRSASPVRRTVAGSAPVLSPAKRCVEVTGGRRWPMTTGESPWVVRGGARRGERVERDERLPPVGRRRRPGPTATQRRSATVLTSAPSASRPPRCAERAARRRRRSRSRPRASRRERARRRWCTEDLTEVRITIRYRTETNGMRKVTVSPREKGHVCGRPAGRPTPRRLGSRGRRPGTMGE